MILYIIILAPLVIVGAFALYFGILFATGRMTKESLARKCEEYKQAELKKEQIRKAYGFDKKKKKEKNKDFVISVKFTSYPYPIDRYLN